MKGFVAGLLLALGQFAAAAGPAIPGDSLYRMSAALTDQAGTALALERGRGHPVVISMFYGSCPHVCPLLIASIQRMENDLPERQRNNLRVLLVSLDPDRDTVEKLQQVAQRHHADLSRWTFARTDRRAVRRLAAALNIQYRRLPSGEINHSTVITLLDAQGRPVRATSSLTHPDAEFQATLSRLTAH